MDSLGISFELFGSQKLVLGDWRIRFASSSDREKVIQVINSVSGERCSLQTDRYKPTIGWEKLLNGGINATGGYLLLVVEVGVQIVGFARLIHVANNDNSCIMGNVGIVLMPDYRSKRIGTVLLKELLEFSQKLGYQVLTADILATNTRSLRLFRRFGFVVQDEHAIYLPFLNAEMKEITVTMKIW